MRNIIFAASQFSCSSDKESNIHKAELVVRNAASAGAQVILLQELFEGLYFCSNQDPDFLQWAHPVQDNPLIKRFASLATELSVVIAVPFFEKGNNSFFNSCAIVDADGSLLGTYRKSHIPDGPGYQEKFYFAPGDSGFKVFSTRYCKVGIAICWDQWFPEAARVLALRGAEVILYPTAIGNEPQDPSYNSYPHWCRTMMGHAAANMVPIVVSNRVGTETLGSCTLTFHAGSFIANHFGEVVAQVGGKPENGNFDPAPEKVEGFALATLDLDKCQRERHAWGIYRDRRPTLYQPILTLDGRL